MTHVEIECPCCFAGNVATNCYYCQESTKVTKGKALVTILENDPSWLVLHPDCEVTEQK
jgi:hypothetical protein